MTPTSSSTASGPLAPRSGERVRERGPSSPQQATVSVGMAVALGAIAMTFAAILFAYAIVRVQAPSWPPPGEPTLRHRWTWIWLASATIAALNGSAALRAASRNRDGQSPLLLAIAAASGAVFVAIQLIAWTRLVSDGFRPSSGLVASVVYALTLFHAAHAAIAVVLLSPLVVRALRGRTIGAPTFGAVTSFWHLVTIVWLVVAVAVFVG
jgi:cytochrome c oxidase subunit III